MSTSRIADRTMFEVYREPGFNRTYRVVYFTELGDHNREAEFNRALAGDHYLDGFLDNGSKDQAKAIIDEHLRRLNDGEEIEPAALARELAPHLA